MMSVICKISFLYSIGIPAIALENRLKKLSKRPYLFRSFRYPIFFYVKYHRYSRKAVSVVFCSYSNVLFAKRALQSLVDKFRVDMGVGVNDVIISC